MQYIKVGGVNVPVWPTVQELTGSNVSRSPSLTLPSTYEMWEAGVSIGNSLREYQVASNACTIPGGRTTVHDDSELVITAPYDGTYGDEGAKEKKIDWLITHQSGGSAVSLDSGTQVVVDGVFVGTSSTNRTETDWHWLAIPYKWVNASLPDEQKVMNYRIYLTHQSISTVTTSGNQEIRYYLSGTSIPLSFAYINKTNGTYTYLDPEDEPEPEDDPFNPSEDEPYNPDQDDSSDLIDIPTDPTIGISNAGWVHVYNPTTGGLVNFGAWLFPNPELPSTADPTEIVNYLLLLCQTLANSRLIDYVLDCHIIPVSPQVAAAQDIKVGGRTAVGISAPVVASDYITVSCGSLNIQEYFGGFQDFLLTKSHLYLPFIGFVDVLPEYWQSGTIAVDYKFNVIDGSFMVYVRSASHRSQLNGSVIAQYSGNACMHIPITGINYANMVSGLVGAAVAAQGAQGASAVLGQAYSAANTILSGGNMIQSNGYNATAAMLGVRYPYLVIERPVPSYPSQYGHSKGFPSNIYTQLSGISGYTIIDDIDLSGIPLMEVELNELRTLLKEGVYF